MIRALVKKSLKKCSSKNPTKRKYYSNICYDTGKKILMMKEKAKSTVYKLY